MDSTLLNELLAGPYGFLVAIGALGWLIAKEIRKARAEDVEEARAEAQAEKDRRLEVEADREKQRVEHEATVKVMRTEHDAEREKQRTEHSTSYELLWRNYIEVRRLATGAGVEAKEMPPL